jgi:hypothetical protein
MWFEVLLMSFGEFSRVMHWHGFRRLGWDDWVFRHGVGLENL